MTPIVRLRRRSMLHIAATLLVAAAGIGATLRHSSGAGDAAVIHMTVKRFEYTPHELHLKRGVPVVLEIRSLDVVHGFTLPELGVRADVIPGQPARVALRPAKTGTFTFRCDVFCGSGHEDLDGIVVVTD
jgi:cytochrome c oxidase subunit II